MASGEPKHPAAPSKSDYFTEAQNKRVDEFRNELAEIVADYKRADVMNDRVVQKIANGRYDEIDVAELESLPSERNSKVQYLSRCLIWAKAWTAYFAESIQPHLKQELTALKKERAQWVEQQTAKLIDDGFVKDRVPYMVLTNATTATYNSTITEMQQLSGNRGIQHTGGSADVTAMKQVLTSLAPRSFSTMAI